MNDDAARPMDEKYPGTRGISYDDMERLRVDGDGRLLWDGKLIQVQRRITLSLWQRIAAVIVTVATLSQGLLAGFDFGCRLGAWTMGCGK